MVLLSSKKYPQRANAVRVVCKQIFLQRLLGQNSTILMPFFMQQASVGSGFGVERTGVWKTQIPLPSQSHSFSAQFTLSPRKAPRTNPHPSFSCCKPNEITTLLFCRSRLHKKSMCILLLSACTDNIAFFSWPIVFNNLWWSSSETRDSLTCFKPVKLLRY